MKIINIKPDNIRDKEAMNLMKMVALALENYNLETCLDTKELPLCEELTLDTSSEERNLKVYAVTKFSVVDISGEHIKFLKLDRDDIYTLQDYIHDMYEVEY
jgi:hypothetical protein